MISYKCKHFEIKWGVYIITYKKLLILCLIIVLFVSISSVSAIDSQQSDNLTLLNHEKQVIEIPNNNIRTNENITLSEDNAVLGVSNSDDVLGGTRQDLSNKISSASSGSTVYLDDDYLFTTGSQSSSGIYIYSNDLVIDGNGHTIDANGLGRIFNVPSDISNITFKNIVFKNAYYNSNGAAINFLGANLTIINCTFDNNTARSSRGGAIFVNYYEGSVTNIINSSFNKNNAGSDGGAIYLSNPNNQQHSCYLNIEGCNFTENSDTGSLGGGAIYIHRSYETTIRSSKFIRNTALGEGGAIRYSGTTSIYDSEFYENSASHGGALCYGQAVDLKLENIIFVNNSASNQGGSMKVRFIEANNITIINSTANSGGAIFSRSGTAEIQNSRIINASATQGGSIFIHNEVSTFLGSNLDISNTQAVQGGAIYSDIGGTMNIVDSSIDNASANYGGAVYINKGKATISSSTIENSTATLGGGAVYVKSNNVEIKNSLIKNNTAPIGGGVYWNGNNGKISETDFVDNSGENGSSIYWAADNGIVEKSTFNDNNVTTGSIHWHGDNGQIVDNKLLSDKGIYLCEHSSNATLKQNTELAPEGGNYSVYIGNTSTANLIENNFNNLINNNGKILTQVYITSLDNITVISGNDSMIIYTSIVDDNGNYFDGIKNIVNVYDNQNLPTTYNGTHFISNIDNIKIGEHRVHAIGYDSNNFANITVKSGGILYLVLNLTVEQVNYGETVTITLDVVNTTYNDTVDIAVNDVHYNVTLINGTAVLVLHNLAPNTYDIVASFNEYNQSLSTDVEIKVVLRNSTINVTANNVYYGNVTTITVNTTNGTTGNVFLFVNNKMYTINLINSTGQYNLTNLAGGNYTVFAFYNGDVLFDSSYNETTFTVYKYNTPINITVNDIYAGQIATIDVKFPEDINGKAYVYVNDNEYVYYNKTSITIYESDLPAGNITVRVYHDGNEKYYENNTVTYFNVTKKNMTIIVQTADIMVGENATISVIIPADAKGHVTLNVNGTQYYEYANGTVAKFIIGGLARGSYNITAVYQEGPLYNTANATSSFNVNYVRAYDFNVSASADNDLNVYVDISLPSDIDGDVYVNINGTNYTASMSKGKDIVTIPGLLGGSYNGTVYIVNDSKYLSSNRTFTVNLIRNTPTITVDYNSTIYVDDDAIIKVTTDSDATGNITITINNTNYTKEIENGVATFNITGLSWNNYRFNVTYSGDRKYSSGIKDYPLNVIRISNYYAELYAADIYVGDNATIVVKIEEDATGNVTIIINGTTHTFKVENGYGSVNVTGLLSGNHIIDATYTGDNKYEPRHGVFEEFHVRKISDYEFTPSGETNQSNANITVSLPDDATGYVNITVNGRTYPDIVVENGQANLTVQGLEPGREYPVKVDYGGNEKYEQISKNITLNSHKTLDYNFTVEGDTIYVGDVAYLKIYLPEANTTDKVSIKLEDNDPIEVFVGNGTIIRPVSGLAEGKYFILVEYLGNEKFEASSKSTEIFVSKITQYKFDIVTNSPNVGENLTINITLPDDAKGNVTVRINEENYTANITNGTVYFEIPNLAYGKYDFTVYYVGDDKYHDSYRTSEAFVTKVYPYQFDVTPVDIYVGENETIKIVLPNDVNGNVTITIDNTEYTNNIVNVVNGTGWFNVTGLKEGVYSLSVSLKNDIKYRDNAVASSFKVSPIEDYLFEVTVSNPNYVRDNITFTVELPTNASGNVSVILFGNEYQGTVENGVAVVNITAPYYGTFSYSVSFEEKGKYTLKTQTGSVVISKLNVDLNPEFKSPVQVNENVTFKVQLPKDATGTINVITRMVTYSVELVNGSANITVPGYPLAQSYSPSISYSGDDRYNANSTPVNLVVIKVSDYNLTVNVSDINVGQVEVVNITLPADATEDILIYGNFSERTYSQHINDGNVSFNITDLAAGTYNITVLYQGFNKYESKNVTKTFTVSKVNSTITIELVGRTIVVSLPDDATGNVSISIGDINENVTIVNGKAILDISNVYPDEYEVTASYAGDGKYLENATYKTITLPKVTDYLINVTVSDIIVGENATVIVNLPTDANGYANITVNNTSYNNIEVKNGIAKLNVSKLSVGDYLVKVNFTDNKYALNYNSTTFRVNKIKTILTPVITVEGRNITVVVGITENATGNITIYVDNVPKDCEIIDNKVTLTLNNTMPGDHLIKAYYDGDVNHTSAETSFYAVTVNKISDYDLIIDLTNIITVIENNTITVTFPDEASGRVTFNYNEEFIDTEINTDTHTATVTLPWLKEGQYDVYISYSDALYDYVENSTSFTVVKLNTTIDVEVNNITKELSEIINITLNETATGDLYINVNGTVYHVTLDDGGKANLTLINLADGNYTAVVSYNGDDFFNVNSTTVYFTVSKMPLNITINASNIIVGNVLAIKFNMSREITDLVTVQVGETNYTTFVYKGNGSLDVYNLTVGDYDIIVYYAGSEDYLNVSNKTNISVIGKKASSINVTVADITVGENITVYVNATKGINGPVYVTIGGLAYTRNLVDGEVNFTVSNLTARDYVISAFFMGNDEFDLCNTTSNFTVHKKNPTLDLSVSDIDISQLVNVSVKVPKDATGHVLININGTDFYADIINGTANYTIRPSNTGYFVVNATYLGDDNYLSNITNGSYTVFKIDTGINITGKDIFVGQNVTFNITLGVNITEVVIINVASETDKTGKNYTTFVENGNGTYTVFDLPEGEYTVTVYFPGNTKYAAVNNTTNIKVNAKKSSQITVEVSNITVDEDVVVYVNVTEGATGNVTIVIAGDAYTKPLTGDKVNFTLSSLSARDYHVTAYYFGDNKYLPSNTTGKFTVYKKNAELGHSVTNTTVGNVEFINITLPKDATGYVLLTVDGAHYYADVIDGVAKFNVTGLLVDEHDVNVTYMGDNNYNISSTLFKVNISKITTLIEIAGENIIVGQGITLIIKTSEDISDLVTINIGNNNYTTFISKGKGNLTVYDLNVGKYTATVYYNGDDTYNKAENKTSFEVTNKKASNVSISVNNIVVGQDEIITVRVTAGATGNVTIVIRGRGYVETLNNGVARFTISDLSARDYEVTAIYNGDENYLASQNTAKFTVSKLNLDVIVTAQNITAGSTENIEINLSENENGIVLVNVGSNGYYVNITDGNGVLILNHLNAGDFNVSAVFLGDDKYNSQSNVTSFTVKPVTDEDIKINVDDENKTIIIEVPGNQTGNVTVIIDGKNVTGKVINNTIVVNITDLLPGNHTVEVIYGDKNYTVYENTTDIVIPKVDDYPFDVDVAVDGNNVEFSVNLPKDTNGVVLVDVDGKGYYMNVTNGAGKLLLTDLNKGTYDVGIKYSGDNKYAEVKKSTSFTIESGRATPIDINAEDINVGDNLTVKVIVPGDAKGNAVVEINGKTYTSPINNGIAEFNILGLNEGNYTIKATFAGDAKYPANSTSTTVQVSKVKDYPMNVTVDGKDITINLPEDAEGNVTVIVDGKNYTAKAENGTATIKVDDLKPGKHNITVSYGDEKYSPKTNTSIIDVANKLFIDAPAVVKYYSGPERFYVYLEDMNGKKIANANITITVNGVSYSRTTNENGTASIAISLNSGEYLVTVTFKGNSEFNQTSVSSSITVNPTIYADDVFKVFRNGTHYYALFTDAQGNPLSNAEVSFNIHGVFYTRTTNATGWAKLNINLEKGTYILTAINPVTKEMRTNNVTVISLIVENYDITKYFRNGTQFVARIVADNGLYAGAGEKVTFNINGVFYTRVTDENGYVRLNINIEPGQYIITTYYKDCRESNTIIVLPTLIADDMKMSYHDGSQFVVHLLDGQGKPYPNQLINFNIHGIIYNRLTDSNGDAKLSINLQSGEYLITSTYGAAKLSNKITIV